MVRVEAVWRGGLTSAHQKTCALGGHVREVG